MKHLLIGIIFATLLATVFVSCRQGEKGEPGPAGTSTQILPYKIGSITGTITGTTQYSEEDFTQNVNFQYFKSPTDNALATYDSDGTYYRYTIARYDSIGRSYIKLAFTLEYYDLDGDGTDEAHIYDTDISVVVNKQLANNDAFYFGTCYGPYNNPFDVETVSLSDQSSGGSSNVTYDNIAVNSTTGVITFDYSVELGSYDNSSYHTAYITGSVSAAPYNVSYRQAAQ